MFFFASKTIGWLLTPTNFMVTLAGLGLICLLTRHAAIGRKLLVASALLFVVCACTPVCYWLLVPLEERFPAWDATAGPPTGIILLGGSINPELSAARNEAVFPYATDRFVAAAELARRYPEIPVIFTGGSASLAIGDAREADYAANIFERLGLPKDRLILERESRNTVENARFTKIIAQPISGDRWLLITSAYHMPRSVGIFRKVGLPVEPYPVDWLTRGKEDLLKFDKPIEGLLLTDRGAREWIGMMANWLSGSGYFFPDRQ